MRSSRRRLAWIETGMRTGFRARGGDAHHVRHGGLGIFHYLEIRDRAAIRASHVRQTS